MLTERELEWRRAGIGSSEIGVLAGHGLYRNVTPLTIWESKLYGSKQSSSTAMLIGSFFEPGIKELYLAKLGENVKTKKAGGRVHHGRRWQRATCDYYIRKPGAKRAHRILECKYVAPGMEKHWDPSSETGIPDMVADQIQWQMDVTGIREADVCAVLAGPRETPIWRVGYEKAKAQALLDIGREFWEKHVLAQIPPMLDWTDASKAYLKRTHGRHTDDIVTAPPEAEELARAYRAASVQIADLERVKAESKHRLCALIGDHAGIETFWGRATWKAEQHGHVDDAAMLAELTEDMDESEFAALVERHRKNPIRVFRLSMKE